MNMLNHTAKRATLLLAAAALTFPALAHALQIEKAHARYLETAEFQRIAEFFTGREHPGNRAILRSTPDQRDGAYFILSLDTPTDQFPAGSIVVLDVISSATKDPVEFRFDPASASRASRQLYLGLTGEDWPGGADTLPMAWRVRVLGPNEATLAEWKSFLWEMPGK